MADNWAELRMRLEDDVRRGYLSLRKEMDSLELTPDQVAQLREAISQIMEKYSLSALDFGQIVAIIISIVGREKLLDDIEKKK